MNDFSVSDKATLLTGRKIAFYAPLKPIDHPVPSGDRLMAQLLIKCLTRIGYQVQVVSSLRVFLKDPDGVSHMAQLKKQAVMEIAQLARNWSEHGKPALWFCYHPYFKSPDLMGPQLCDMFDIPYVTAEASHSPRRAQGLWAGTQQMLLESLDKAAVNICFTERDAAGIAKALPQATLARLRPFIDTSGYASQQNDTNSAHLVTVAMMRAGDKMRSYKQLAAALELLLDKPWSLSIVGDGQMQADVRQLFARIPSKRIKWHGRLDRTQIAELFAQSALFAWPGCAEAYGLAYLEAQASGLPVVAFDTAGVPEVVKHDHTGILTPEGDDRAFSLAITDLLQDQNKLRRFSDNARKHVATRHTLAVACDELQTILNKLSN